MREYRLEMPRNAHGQPIHPFRFNQENNTSKAIDQLSGICAGILADGEVTEKEADFFAAWVKRYAPFQPVWPFTDILARISEIYADGKCDDDERLELKAIMQAICGYRPNSEPDETYSSTLPLNDPAPDPIIFDGQVFNVTGKFAYGTRNKVIEAITARNGMATDSPPSRDSKYLVIGIFASRDWINTNYGRKIERAVELRTKKSGIAIISEEHWRKYLV